LRAANQELEAECEAITKELRLKEDEYYKSKE
jgi:hypothetical protein